MKIRSRLDRSFGFLLLTAGLALAPLPALARSQPPGFVLARTWGGTGTDVVNSVVLDAAGNVYLAGASGSFGAGSNDVLVIKYSRNGTFLWAETWGGTGDDDAYGIAIGPDGYLYVVGTTASYGAGNYDALLLKFDTEGQLLWSTTWGGRSFDRAYDISFDASGNIYIVGESYSSGNSAVLLKFSASGGAPLFASSWKSSATYDSGYSLAVDSAGDVIITGISWDYSVSPNHNSILIVKYDGNGNYLWSENYSTPIPAEDEAWSFHAIATDDAGNIYIVGRHADQCLTYEFNSCDFSVLVLKVDGTGAFSWAETWGGPTYDAAGTAAFDPSGNLLVGSLRDVYGTPNLNLLSIDPQGAINAQSVWNSVSTMTGNAFPGMTTDSLGNAYLAASATNNTGSWAATTGTVEILGNSIQGNSYQPSTPVGSISHPIVTPARQTAGILNLGGGAGDAFLAKYLHQ